MSRKVHPRQAESDGGRHGDISETGTLGIVLTSPKAAASGEENKRPASPPTPVAGSHTRQLVADMKSMPQAVPAAATGLSGTDDDVFTRLRDNAEKRYVGGDAPMVVPMKTDPSFKYVISPNHEVMRYWDLATTFCILFTMSVTPFEVAFLQPKIDVLFAINRMVDLVFLGDIVINFFLMYIERETGKWVSQLRIIRYKYIRGTFVVDVVSILPFDVIGIVVNSPAVSNLKALPANPE
mmetsp:Transcript_8824/g.14023  ORF Transcript_8824/g.14023 Transcript_8824/m.14023 type:complete len:238 (-) Transcript_8824:183-896(-)